MTTGLSLEHLAQVLHADRQHAFTQERLVRQVELAQAQTHQAAHDAAWWDKIKRLTARQFVVTLVVHPLRLTVQCI
ncbi:MAG: hypothetical protein U0350_28765 [Caldilineaceae bacterium]